VLGVIFSGFCGGAILLEGGVVVAGIELMQEKLLCQIFF